MTAFTVVMPAYNAQRTIAAALTSVQRQLETDLEVIVVDDGSADDTVAIAERICAQRGWRVLTQANAGPSAARNLGIREARGRWIALLDSDDLLLPTHLARMRTMLESRPGLGLAFADAWVWDEPRRRFERGSANGRDRPRPLPADGWSLFRRLMWGNFVFVASCFDRELALRLGGFNEDLRAGEDWELWLRLVAGGAAVVAADERQAVYRVSPGQASGDRTFMHEGAYKVWRSLQERCDLPADVAADLEARVAAHAGSAVGASAPRSPLRDFAGRATRWAMPVRDYRITTPRAVAPVADLL